MNVHDDTSRCEWARGCIDAYLDGELTGVDVTVMESHLEICGECSEEPGGSSAT
ncbi:MAG: zf-HC2 domain-containing protein [bacterium]